MNNTWDIYFFLQKKSMCRRLVSPYISPNQMVVKQPAEFGHASSRAWSAWLRLGGKVPSDELTDPDEAGPSDAPPPPASVHSPLEKNTLIMKLKLMVATAKNNRKMKTKVGSL